MKRWLTGILAGPLVALIIYFGSEPVFSVLIIIVALIGANEYNRMTLRPEQQVERLECVGAAFVLNIAAFVGGTAHVLAAAIFSFVAIFIIFLLKCSKGRIDTDPLRRAALGIFYPSLLIAHFILLRKTDAGVMWIFLVIIIAFVGDTAAFYTGRKFGRIKLLPNVSSGKTVEGCLGSIAGSIAGALIFRYFALENVSLLNMIVMTVFANVLGQAGDLCESTLKRSSGLKDSGVILPGHGGLLDRIDSLLFICPFIYYYVSFEIL